MMWQLVWTIVFFTFVVAFGVMSIIVSVMGAFDVKRLLRGLKDDQDNSMTKK